MTLKPTVPPGWSTCPGWIQASYQIKISLYASTSSRQGVATWHCLAASAKSNPNPLARRGTWAWEEEARHLRRGEKHRRNRAPTRRKTEGDGGVILVSSLLQVRRAEALKANGSMTGCPGQAVGCRWCARHVLASLRRPGIGSKSPLWRAIMRHCLLPACSSVSAHNTTSFLSKLSPTEFYLSG